MFSAADARDVLESQRRHDIAIRRKTIRLCDNGDISDGDLHTLFLLYLRYIDTEIRSTVNNKGRQYECVLVPPSELLKRHFHLGHIPTDAQMDVLRERLIDRILIMLRQHDYKVKQIDPPSCNTFYRITWSTTPLARHQWGLLIAHLVIRCALVKYVRRLMDGWLTPPSGRLYLKAQTEFNNYSNGRTF